MIVLPTREQLVKASEKRVWDFGNEILYDLCREHFSHTRDEEIVAKVLFIGRIYAAAVERGKKKQENINDDFYTKVIAPEFRKSKIDKYLTDLRQVKEIASDNIPQILSVHYYLISILNKTIDREKRSFCSKYLHFHCPDLFFIYDSRVVSALRKYIGRVPNDSKIGLGSNKVDAEYSKFFSKCFHLRGRIKEEMGISLTNRQFDNFLIDVANSDLSNRKIKGAQD